MKIELKTISVALLLSLLFGVFAFGGVALAADSEQQAQYAAPIMVVNTSFLNVRSGPGPQYTVLATTVGGTELPVLGRTEDNIWYQVSTTAGVGWVNAEFLIPRGDFRYVPVVTAPPVVVAPVVSVQTVVVPGTTYYSPLAGTTYSGGGGSAGMLVRATLGVPGANVYAQPNESSGVVGTLLQDSSQDYAVVGVTTDTNFVQWYQIVVPGVGTGWIDTGKIRVRLSAEARPVVTVVAQFVGLSPAPGSAGANPPVITNGTEAYLLEVLPSGQVKIQLLDGSIGYVPFDSVQQRTGTVTDRPGFDYSNLSPTTSGAFSYLIGQGVYVPYDISNTLAHIVVNTGFLNVRSGPGGQYTVIGTLPGGAELAVLAFTPDSEWYLVQGGFGQGWIDSEFVLFRGNADSVPVISYESVTSIAPPVISVQGAAAPVAVSPATTTASARAIVNTSYLNVRSGPGGQYGLITTLPGGTELAALGITPDSEWYLVRGSFGDGWIDSEFVIFRGDFRALATIQYPQGTA